MPQRPGSQSDPYGNPVRVLDLFTNHLTTMVSSGLNQPSALLADGPDRLLIADRAAIHVVDTNLRNGVAPRHVVNLQRPSDLAWLHHRVLLVVEQVRTERGGLAA